MSDKQENPSGSNKSYKNNIINYLECKDNAESFFLDCVKRTTDIYNCGSIRMDKIYKCHDLYMKNILNKLD